MDTVYIDHINTNPDESIEVGYHVNDEPVGAHALPYASYSAMIEDNRTLLTTPEIGARIALASWIGIDPTGGDQSRVLNFRVEIDPGALVAIRRVLAV